MEVIKGTLERITWQDKASGRVIGKLRVDKTRQLITVLGVMIGASVGSVLSLTGEWTNHPNYGKQFKVVKCKNEVPATVEGIEKYLGSGLIKGIGPVNARNIVKKFGINTLHILDNEPHRLAEVPGIAEKRIEMIKEAWASQREIKNIMIFLQGHGVTPNLATKIYKKYGTDSINTVKENPYRLADEMWGVGFKTADKIALKMGYKTDSYARCRSGMLYVLKEMADKEGHCFATREELLERSAKLLGVTRDKLTAYVDDMLKEGSLIEGNENSLYLPVYFHSELGVAKRIKQITRRKSKFRMERVDQLIDKLQTKNNIIYDDIQRQAIKTAINSKFMVLTGGPGTGKTTTSLSIIEAFEQMGARILLVAPTGRAAKRLSETTGREAMTIHRALEYNPQNGYQRNEQNPLRCDVILVDESSMIDIMLMYSLLKAIPDNCVVILVGDVDQLPSVGAGNVLKDIIDSGVVDVVKLTRIFRQAQNSMIVTNAHKINKGQIPSFNTDLDSDYIFMQEEDNEEIVNNITFLCKDYLPSKYGYDPFDDIQVLTPMQKGLAGAMNLNKVLQDVLNPQKLRVKFYDTEFRLNDKVMQIKNNYDKNVFNGDIGRVVHIDLEEQKVSIKFDGNIVEYDVSELDEVVLAYATTVHKSQGSEYKAVVMPITTQHYILLQRNLLYTGVTRAKELMIPIGMKRAMAMAVKNDKIRSRNSMLAKTLRQLSVVPVTPLEEWMQQQVAGGSK